jgi:ferredoxin
VTICTYFGSRRRALPVFCIPVGELVKSEAKSQGIETPRNKKPKELTVITECCAGCSGSPAGVPYCPVADCMYWVPDEDHPAFGRIEVDPELCIGCKKWTSKGPDGSFLDDCPWDAIEMLPTEDVESRLGTKFQF